LYRRCRGQSYKNSGKTNQTKIHTRRFAWNYVKDYKNWLPLLIVGVCCISCGVVEAGVIQNLPIAEGIASVVPKPPMLPPVPWWTIINVVLVANTLFI
jgi:hypothetical protein